jgi:hypothetical protein
MQQRIGIWNDGAPHIKRYAEHVGALVVNFGFIEYLSFQWISALQEDIVLIQVAADMQLSQRILLVRKLAERKLNDPEKKEAMKLWERVRVLSELRNAVCHNPYMFAWTSGKEEGEPDVAATPLLRNALRGNDAREMPNLNEIAAGVVESGKIANQLFELILKHMDSLAEKKST